MTGECSFTRNVIMAEIKALLEGYRHYYRKYFASSDTLYEDLLSKGQSPKTLVIACSDSRVDPSIVTSAQPGDIFVIRNVANLVPPYQVDEDGLHGVSAALEFAVCILEVRHIVIMGHSNCAGIRALLDAANIENTDFIGKWMSLAKPAKDRVAKRHGDGICPDEGAHHCEKESILFSLENLMTFPWVRLRVETGKLKLHGWYLSLDDGRLECFDPMKNRFEKVSVENYISGNVG